MKVQGLIKLLLQ